MENKENLTDIISENLIYYRKKAKLTQSELANELDYSDKSISKWERGEGLPDILTFARLAKLYGLSINDFVTKKKKEKIANLYLSKILITALSIALVWFIAVLIFVCLEVFTNLERSWLIFIYSISISAILSIIFNDVFFQRFYNIISTSILCWSIVLSIYLTFDFPNKHLLFLVAIPLEILIVLFYILLKKKKD